MTFIMLIDILVILLGTDKVFIIILIIIVFKSYNYWSSLFIFVYILEKLGM